MLHFRYDPPLTSGTQLTAAKGRNIPLGDKLPLGILVTDQHGKCLYSNAAYQKLCGRSADELIGSHWSAAIHPQDRNKSVRHWEQAVLGHCAFPFEARLQLANGAVTWTRHNAALMTDDTPDLGYVHTVEDINTYKAHELARKNAEEQLFEEKERAQVTLDSIGDAVISTSIDRRVSYMNAVAEQLTGFCRDEAIGQPLQDIFQVVDAKSLKPTADPAQRAIQSNSIVALEANSLLIAKGGMKLAIEDSAAPIHNRHGAITGAVIVFHDARFSRENTSRMAYLAQHDVLTGLHNRNAFDERFKQSLALAKRHGKKMGMLFIDVDNFKELNDSLGHETGDMILAALARVLRAYVRLTDTICRYGGDEFVVLLSEIDKADQALAIAIKIRETAAAPTEIAGHDISLQLSIGASVYPDNGETADALLKTADAAMYQVKALKRSPLATRSQVITSEP